MHNYEGFPRKSEYPPSRESRRMHFLNSTRKLQARRKPSTTMICCGDRPGRSSDVNSSFGQQYHPPQSPEVDLISSELEPGDRGYCWRRLHIQWCWHLFLRRRFHWEDQEKGARAESAWQGQRQGQRQQLYKVKGNSSGAMHRAQTAVSQASFFSQGKNPERETHPLQGQRQRETNLRTLPSDEVVHERQHVEVMGWTTTPQGGGVPSRNNFTTQSKISHCNSTNSVVLSVQNECGGHQTRKCISFPRKLKLSLRNWQMITPDQWVLNAVKGATSGGAAIRNSNTKCTCAFTTGRTQGFSRQEVSDNKKFGVDVSCFFYLLCFNPWIPG